MSRRGLKILGTQWVEHYSWPARLLSTIEEQWYVEDPFDLKHNLAGKCTRAGKKRIMDEMKNALQTRLFCKFSA